MFKRVLQWFTKKEPLRKVRLLEFERFVKVYSETIAPIQTLTLKSNVLVDGLTFYVEGYIDDLVRVDVVGYLDDVEFLRVNYYIPRLETSHPDLQESFMQLREQHKLRRLDLYLRWSFIEGRDYYDFESLRTQVRAAEYIELQERIFKTLGLSADLLLDGSRLTLEIATYYPNIVSVNLDTPMQIDSKHYALDVLFLKDLEDNYLHNLQ